MTRWKAVAAALVLVVTVAAVAQAGFVQSGKLLVSFEAGLRPSTLPRSEQVPITVGFKGSFEKLDATDTPALDTMRVRLSRGGSIDSAGLPRCSSQQLRNRTSEGAMAACGDALVGEGSVSSAVRFPDGKRLRARSKLLLFNARGQILMHLYTTKPLRGTFLVPMSIKGGVGGAPIALEARFPRIASGYGYLTGFEMVLHRTFTHAGKTHSYLLASCPAPPGLNRVSFELAQVTYRFRDGTVLRNGAIRSCSVRSGT